MRQGQREKSTMNYFTYHYVLVYVIYNKPDASVFQFTEEGFTVNHKNMMVLLFSFLCYSAHLQGGPPKLLDVQNLVTAQRNLFTSARCSMAS